MRHLEKYHSAWNTTIIEDVTKKDLVKIYNYIITLYINNSIYFIIIRLYIQVAVV